jgi:LAO/AO transport system kinase
VGGWKPPVVMAVAQSGRGIDELVAELGRHRTWLEESGELARRRTRRAREEIEAIAVASLRDRWENVTGAQQLGGDLDALAEAVVAGEKDPYAAADELVATASS